MTTIPVIFHSFNPDVPSYGFWDQEHLKDLFGEYTNSIAGGYNYDVFTSLQKVDDGAILIFPARSHVELVDKINQAVAEWRWVIFIVSGDEENVFPVEKLSHPNKMIYLMSPHFDHDLSNVDRFIGEGYTPHTIDGLDYSLDKDIDVFFAGQRNHLRREQAIDSIKTYDPKGERWNIYLHESEGFAQGMDREEYIQTMAKAKVVPCPSGPATPDTFRFYEALELGCVPLADTTTPDGSNYQYWQKLFGTEDLPFELITDWEHSAGNVSKVLSNYPLLNNRCFAWWQLYCYRLRAQIADDIRHISGIVPEVRSTQDKITVLICTSPIRSHPSTDIIIETIESIRSRSDLRECEILIMIDGVRDEQQYLFTKYQEYIHNLLHYTQGYEKITPIMFDKHMHQSGMTKEALKYVRTPTILFIEHDTPLTGEINFDAIADTVVEGTADLIRLHHETHILKEHKHMMIDLEPQEHNGIGLMRTVQWSQRPHVASVEFYKRILENHFSEQARTMIEDVMHGVVHAPYEQRGLAAWHDFRLWMYTPDPEDMKRSTNLDGRGDEQKYGMIP